MSLLTRAWKAEPVAILTILGIIVQAVLDATADGWDTHTAITAAVTAVAGLIARQTVYSPKTGERLEGELLDQ